MADLFLRPEDRELTMAEWNVKLSFYFPWNVICASPHPSTHLTIATTIIPHPPIFTALRKFIRELCSLVSETTEVAQSTMHDEAPI